MSNEPTRNLDNLLERQRILRRSGPKDLEITGICQDSRQVRAGSLFVAVRGLAADGHAFIGQALAQGAVAVIMEVWYDMPPGVAGILVPDSRVALSLAVADFFGNPDRGIPVVGVTGTNGKTTTTYLIEAVLRAAGQAPAVFGTVNYRFGAEQLPASHTTPDAVELLATAADFRRRGAAALVMEVSSHALDQHRVDGLDFSVAVFTNLTPEHLDYHPDMEHYFRSKERLFVELLSRSGGRGVVCIDDDFGRRLARAAAGALTCGLAAEADVHPLRQRLSVDGIAMTLATPVGELELVSPLVGPFNVQNLLCAVGAAIVLDVPPATIVAALASAPPVPGRLERIENERGALVLVDYAHTGDALEKALAAGAALAPQRILTVFGCGGDRDRRKRPVMGEVAARASRLTIVTSDNPRTEEPQAIIDEVCAGVARVHPRPLSRAEAQAADAHGYVVIPERREAIRFAVALLRAGDLLLVAGKGHEDYQIIGKQKFHFDDREELRAALRGGEMP